MAFATCDHCGQMYDPEPHYGQVIYCTNCRQPIYAQPPQPTRQYVPARPQKSTIASGFGTGFGIGIGCFFSVIVVIAAMVISHYLRNN